MPKVPEISPTRAALPEQMPATAPKQGKETRRWRFSRLMGFSLLICVILPTLLFAYYTVFHRSPLYMSEARLMVSSADNSSNISGAALNSFVRKIGKGTSLPNHGDVYSARDYILSRNIIYEIGGKERLIQVFSGAETDVLSRLDPTGSIEDFWLYWQDRVTAYVDPTSDILIVRVHAFQPEDAQKLMEDIVASTEKLINDMSVRRRQQALEMARAKVAESLDEVARTRAEMLELQQETGVIDPLKTAAQITKLISELKLERIELEIDLSTRGSSGLRNDTRNQETEYKIGAISRQIEDLQGQLVNAGRADSMISVLRHYELLALNEEFQTQIYTIDRNAYENAKRALEEQQKYLSVIVKALPPEKPINTNPTREIIMLFFALLVLWGIVTLTVSAIRDR
ncbi:capsular polysaccharide transport system permease protein [Rhodobacter sp. JA431]|uniref:hypothetical protein n=1 Tax=Rhodobacter sp. JA431 TaxID=570013 RepID=UPI000BCE83C2|nr:hypothetical protein [Rhodobacter sp. JA431]SOC08277.1 capsular polysaccharide transport system permease protein [Rhodobacter sp. JA431]